MPATMTMIRGRAFLQTTPDGDLDLKFIRALLKELPMAKAPPEDFDILLDLRRMQ